MNTSENNSSKISKATHKEGSHGLTLDEGTIIDDSDKNDNCLFERIPWRGVFLFEFLLLFSSMLYDLLISETFTLTIIFGASIVLTILILIGSFFDALNEYNSEARRYEFYDER